MKKSILLIFLLFLTVFSIFAQDSSKTLILKTDYFDIIYEEQSIYTASLLYNNADNMYRQICSTLGVVPSFRMPITIRSDVQTLNAYFTPSPYNRIVLYDTAPDTMELAHFDETMLKVFYHELVHAVSLNIRSPEYQKAANIFGDIVNTSLFLLPLNMVEGVTVSFESADGKGRLNNGFTLYPLVESKLEGNFPSFSETAGAADDFYAGAYSYFFGGAFSEYLQKKYGMEKYADFWKESGRFNLSVGSVFKKVYKTSLNSEWSEFEKTIPVLPVNDKVDIELLTKLGYHVSLTASKDSLVYIDRQQKAVMCVKDGKTKKLFSTNAETRSVNISEDGKFLAVVQRNSGLKYQVKIFDVEKSSFIATIPDLRNANFYKSNGSTYVIGHLQENQAATILVYDLADLKEKNITTVKDFSYLGSEVYSLASGKEAQFAFIAKKGNLWQFVLNKNGSTQYFDLPNNILVDDLSYIGDGKYLFSFAEMGYSIPKMGILNVLEDGENLSVSVQMQNDNIKGGVFSPVFVNGEYYFISQFFKATQVSSIKDVPGGLSEPLQLAQNQNSFPLNALLTKNEEYLLKQKSIDYATGDYEQGFMFVPVVMSRYIEGELYEGDYGFSFLTTDPKETFLTTESLYVSKLDGLRIGSASSLTNDIFSLATDITASFDNENSFKDLTASFWESYYYTFTETGTERFIEVSESAQVYGFVNNQFNKFNSAATISASAIIGNSIFELGAQYKGVFGENFIKEMPERRQGQVIGAVAALKIPQLLPFKNPYNAVYNLPTTLIVNSFWNLGKPLSAKVNTVLLSYDVQRGLPFGTMCFARRFILEFNGELNVTPKETTHKVPTIMNEIALLKDTIKAPVFSDNLSIAAYFQTNLIVGRFVPVIDIGAKYSVSFLTDTAPEFSLLLRLTL